MIGLFNPDMFNEPMFNTNVIIVPSPGITTKTSGLYHPIFSWRWADIEIETPLIISIPISTERLTPLEIIRNIGNENKSELILNDRPFSDSFTSNLTLNDIAQLERVSNISMTRKVEVDKYMSLEMTKPVKNVKGSSIILNKPSETTRSSNLILKKKPLDVSYELDYIKLIEMIDGL